MVSESLGLIYGYGGEIEILGSQTARITDISDFFKDILHTNRGNKGNNSISPCDEDTYYCYYELSPDSTVDEATRKSINLLDGILLLPANWNGEGALPFKELLIEACKEIVRLVPVQPEIFPTAAESIQMEYEKASGEYLEFEVTDNKINVFNIDIDGNERSYELRLTEKAGLKDLVRNFYARN